MNIYTWKSNVEARWLTTRREDDLDRLFFDGSARGKDWNPPEVDWILDERCDAKRDITDCPNLTTGTPALSARAAHVLQPLLSGAAELLALSHQTHEYLAVNVTNVVDALDEERSDLMRFASSGRIMLVKAFAFREQAVGAHAVFKDRRLAGTAVFVTEPFVAAVAQARLTGFSFQRVWPGDT